ncbi:Bug family tripartite tricarboxylate transporter substrate binding protein [Variovorax boronicumulans]|uniref:Bug family tripartite tricarboxylate transporter substrate binding protein n=1 Tax=Variovorax boronicumulans TaxID=436515 RepID=UPI0012E5EC10|nr:tripartite tricarboxylate transporter substrate binding protein [Variovorax boronicumulans]GER10005.1 tripartite tricarboxylate transporter substrate binding protein [Variovorax boronicumulans]
MHRIQTFVLAAALACSAPGFAQGFPTRSITMVVPAPAGGASDAIARSLADAMGKALGQVIVVDNKPGASGMLATQLVARAPADGYTLLVTHTTPIYYAHHTFSKVPYDVRRDLAFVTHICDASLVLAVHKDVPARNMTEFIAWARSNKGKVSYGSYGVGSSGHLMSSYLAESRQLGMSHVPYKGEAPMIQDLIGGHIPWAFATAGSLSPHFTSGQLRPLAVVGEQRLDDLPGVPTLIEAGFRDPEFKIIGGLTMMVAAGTPAPVLARLEKEARAAIQTVQLRARFQVFGLIGVGNSAKEAREGFEASGPVIEKLVRISGAKMD